tara:strand:- start:197 stop:439 length:243 start_codon:yes stop_codon:yes gene_type:complete
MVIFASVERVFKNKKLTYKLTLEEAPADIYNADPLIHARALAVSIEKIVIAAPAQYQWEYKIFKRSLAPGVNENDFYRRQ